MDENKKIRVALFGSFYRGYYMLSELLHGPHRELFSVVGVATDDVTQGYISRDKRVWRYPHRPEEETMVAEKAKMHGLPVFNGRIKSEPFYEMYERVWRPQLCVSATFGQLVDGRIFNPPEFGFFNVHPSIDDGWPSKYAGPNPFQSLIDDGCDHSRAMLHRVDAGLDTGEAIALSPRVDIPPGVTVVDMHKLTSPVIAKFVIPELLKLVERVRVERKMPA